LSEAHSGQPDRGRHFMHAQGRGLGWNVSGHSAVEPDHIEGRSSVRVLAKPKIVADRRTLVDNSQQGIMAFGHRDGRVKLPVKPNPSCWSLRLTREFTRVLVGRNDDVLQNDIVRVDATNEGIILVGQAKIRMDMARPSGDSCSKPPNSSDQASF
jgi:hypothetical protein